MGYFERLWVISVETFGVQVGSKNPGQPEEWLIEGRSHTRGSGVVSTAYVYLFIPCCWLGGLLCNCLAPLCWHRLWQKCIDKRRNIDKNAVTAGDTVSIEKISQQLSNGPRVPLNRIGA